MMLPLNEIEYVERTALEIVVQALTDYLPQAVRIFCKETDKAQDIAEDVMRESIEAMGVSGFQERLYGKMDYKKAIYVFVPAAQPIALMLDAKAEKGNGSTTIQMSQTSMQVCFRHQSGEIIREKGLLPRQIKQGGKCLQVVTIIAKYVYTDLDESGYGLQQIIVACIPNGALQLRYNPDADDTIWRVGRNAPTRGEDFRVRLRYQSLADKASWRVRQIDMK